MWATRSRTPTNHRLYKWSGSTYEYATNAAEVKAELFYDKLTAGEIAAGAVGTTQLSSVEILVGGGTGKPPKFSVVDALNNQVAFIGDNGAGFVGGWFKNAKIGPDINSPILDASASGVSISNASIGVTKTGTVVNLDPTNGLVITGASNKAYLNAGYLNVTDAANILPASFLNATSYGSAYSLLKYITAVAGSSNRTITLTKDDGAVGVALNAGAAQYVDVRGGDYRLDGNTVINSLRQFVGVGIDVPLGGCGAAGFYPYYGAVQYSPVGNVSDNLLTNSTSLSTTQGTAWIPSDSYAATLGDLVDDFNSLLSALRTAGLLTGAALTKYYKALHIIGGSAVQFS